MKILVLLLSQIMAGPRGVDGLCGVEEKTVNGEVKKWRAGVLIETS